MWLLGNACIASLLLSRTISPLLNPGYTLDYTLFYWLTHFTNTSTDCTLLENEIDGFFWIKKKALPFIFFYLISCDWYASVLFWTFAAAQLWNDIYTKYRKYSPNLHPGSLFSQIFGPFEVKAEDHWLIQSHWCIIFHCFLNLAQPKSLLRLFF